MAMAKAKAVKRKRRSAARPGRVPVPTMTYLTREERRRADRFAEREAVATSAWIRRCVIAALAAREGK